jgi:DNA-binding transcriptional LysR family regulator
VESIQAIKLFVRVVNLGSFSRAAAEVGVGQPAVTKQISRMEKQLGARLLHRTTHGVSPTEIGLLYYEKCKLIAHHAQEAESVASLLQHQAEGLIRISTSVAFGRRVMAPLTMAFMRMNPHLQIDLNCDDRYVNLVEQGVDVAIRMGRLSDSTLGSSYLGLNPWAVVASPDYLKQKGQPKIPSDLDNHDVLIYNTVQGDDHWHFVGSDGVQVSMPVKGRLRSNNLSMLLSAARQNFGVAALPLYVADASIKNKALVALLELWQMPQQEIHAVFPSPKLVPTKVKLFITWLQGQFGANWWSDNTAGKS